MFRFPSERLVLKHTRLIVKQPIILFERLEKEHSFIFLLTGHFEPIFKKTWTKEYKNNIFTKHFSASFYLKSSFLLLIGHKCTHMERSSANNGKLCRQFEYLGRIVLLLPITMQCTKLPVLYVHWIRLSYNRYIDKLPNLSCLSGNAIKIFEIPCEIELARIVFGQWKRLLKNY